MKKFMMITLACVAAACLATLAIASSNAQAPLAGTWQCVSHGGEQDPMNFTLTFQQDGQSVNGHVSSPLGEADFASGSFKQNHLHFVIQGDSDSYELNADYKDGKLTGTWATTVSGHKGTWEGQKSPESKP
ncbi:MAG: hypothetical protein ACRD2P_06960 [Terriglobia bacterium]